MQTDTYDELLFGWDQTPGIVSVWAERTGQAFIWRRVNGRVLLETARYRPWLYASSLDDLAHVELVASHDPLTTKARFAYQMLDGPHEACRFLISAPSWRQLEQAILQGASKRSGSEIRSLYDLEQRYYQLGPVEQYLIASGRSYFKDMLYTDLHRMQIDFETTALDPTQGRIFLVAVRDSHGLERIIEAPRPEDEAYLIAQLCALVEAVDPDCIENHNLFGFDLPFLEERAKVLHMPLKLGRVAPLPRGLIRVSDAPSYGYRGAGQSRYTLVGRELIDTLDAVRRHDFVTRDMPSHRLKDVARHFGVAAPDRVYIAGADILERYQHEPEQVRRYALGDVAEVDALSQRLLVATFALANMAPRRYERLAYAGPAMGILEPMLIRAYVRARAAIPLPARSGQSDTPHSGGALHLFASGIARHVVKADIASLYPSLMILHRLGPACDQQQALLSLVERLTQRRLQHKHSLRSYSHDSLEYSYHQSLQAAMKLIINSAYGYMGAGRMALFADREAADSVTRHGREVLDHVVGELRKRGVALIEADTDGVYFAVPEGWNEAEERALVADVGATLPALLRLEYEGRYAAMFSHEVKNYALLTYAGELIVRGAAMRSSRSEPFGERFLRIALHALLAGNIGAIRQAYEDSLHALRSRSLSPNDVATRVRLSKTAEEYLAIRRNREAAYEALLAAGRRDWARGERVRFYRSQQGGYVWLPDERENQTQTEHRPSIQLPDYDIDYYIALLTTSYAARLRKAFRPEDFDQLFRESKQLGLFDQPIESIQPLWISCQSGP